MPFPLIDAALLSALTERGYGEPTPVQMAVLEPEALGRDLLVSAQTGSGKTVAFGLAMAPTLLRGEARFGPAAASLALVIAPTRELALQVHRELEWLYAGLGARVASCVGGMDIRREQRTLASGVHIVVGTPGRLRDHVERGYFVTTELRAVVLDEADEMLDLGFQDDLEAILDATPATRRTLLFSATLPREITGLARKYQQDAFRIAASADGEAHADIEYRAVAIPPHDTERAVVNILRFFEAPGALVFCSTREAVNRLHSNLLERGFAVVALSGELSQAERSHALQALRDGHARVCVATDVAARGLDLPDLGLVIQADLPRNAETMQHRSGRTGRAGRKGICVLLVSYTRRRMAERMLANANIQALWFPPPTAEQVRLRDQERLIQEVSQTTDEPTEEEIASAQALVAQRTAEELAAALVRMQRARLPAPEEFFEVRPDRSDRIVSDRSNSDRVGPDRSGGDRSAPAQSDSPAPTGDGDGGGTVWFRMNVGRAANADPRWIIPVICRRGSVQKADIGEIRIAERETQFEIMLKSADHFTARIRRPDPKDPNIRIEPVDGGGGSAPPRRAKSGPPHRKGPPKGKAAYGGDRPPPNKYAPAKHGPDKHGKKPRHKDRG